MVMIESFKELVGITIMGSIARREALDCDKRWFESAQAYIMNNLEGKRIKLISTSDPYTSLKPGDMGTVVDVLRVDLPQSPFTQIWVKWDNGSNLALIDNKDSFDVVDYENR